jgi:hypothetical protein
MDRLEEFASRLELLIKKELKEEGTRGSIFGNVRYIPGQAGAPKVGIVIDEFNKPRRVE